MKKLEKLTVRVSAALFLIVAVFIGTGTVTKYNSAKAQCGVTNVQIVAWLLANGYTAVYNVTDIPSSCDSNAQDQKHGVCYNTVVHVMDGRIIGSDDIGTIQCPPPGGGN